MKACNDDGIWSDENALVHFYIEPAFWQTWWFITGIVLLLTAATILASVALNNRLRNKKQGLLLAEKEKTELQLKTIKNQIDPHFTFNAMNSIGAVIYREDKQKAYSFFTRFSGLIRAVLESSDKIERSLEEEIEFVTNYLELEKLRFQEKFVYTISVDPAVDLSINLPKLIIQAYAENAIKHGLMHRVEGGVLGISVQRSGAFVQGSQASRVPPPATGPFPPSAACPPSPAALRITITDNGIGREASRELNRGNPASTGKGLAIMSRYFDYYAALNKVQITVNIEDLADADGKASGTRVNISVPLS